MARQGVTLMCYWNGRMINGTHGISYEGAAPKPIRVSSGVTHNELMDRMYEVTGFNKKQFKLKITCRYPACKEYISVPVDNDESVDIVFDVARQPGTYCLELYIEKEALHEDSQIHVQESIPVDNQTCILRPTQSNDNQEPEKVATQEAKVDNFLDPGPVDNSVLVLQNQHRSEAIWAGEDPGVLKCRQRLGTMVEWQLDKRIRKYIIQSGFYGVYKIGFIQLDWPLITALVERWRQETHTFHLAVGESTITLQDVALLLGLQIDGHAVTGKGDLQWGDLCEELLGVRPDQTFLQGSSLRLNWLRTHFLQPPPDANDTTLECYARAYILGLIGSTLFADKSGADVQLIFLPLLKNFADIPLFSWGSAVLAFLYRELCRACKKGASEIAGPLILLQLWAWERLSIGHPERSGFRVHTPYLPDSEDTVDMAPLVGNAEEGDEKLPKGPLGCRWKRFVIRKDNPVRTLIFYRDQLDQQTDYQMMWQPYIPEQFALLPDICLRDQHVWQTVAPLICFDVIEWHLPNRVLRQYGLHQGIPMSCDTESKLHAIDKRGRNHYDWHLYHRRYIQLWEARKDTIATGEPEKRPMHYHDQYMKWYRRITRRMITPLTQRSHMGFQPSSGTTHLLVQSLTSIYNQCTKTLGSYKSDGGKQALTDIQTMCTQVLQIIGETRHFEEKSSPTLVQSSAIHADNVELALQHNHEELDPPQATSAATIKEISTRSRGRDRSQNRESALEEKSSPTLVLSSAIHADNVELELQHNHEEMDPPQATYAATIKETSTGSRGRGKSQNRESAVPPSIVSWVSRPVAATQITVPPNIGNMYRHALNQKIVPLVELVQQLEGEEGSTQAIKKESIHVMRPKKKKKSNHL